jgi:alpha-tubulin suppressor-like RCC1 family protein
VKGGQIHTSYGASAAARAAGVTAGERALDHLTDSGPEEPEPEPEPDGTWSQVSASEDPWAGPTTCAVAGDGGGYCWGGGGSGQLGNGSNANSTIPVPIVDSGVLAGKDLERFAVGAETVCALTTNGDLSCWGRGDNGRLGDGQSADSNVPVATSSFGALAGERVTDVAVGSNHACALDSDGRAYCWGDNFFRQLGHYSDSAPVLTATPVDVDGVLAGVRLVDIAAGYNFTCAVADDGAGYCWGSDRGFELGMNDPRPIPMTGALSGERIAKISMGSSHTCGLTETGQAFCWGYNEYGQLGNGETGEYLGWDVDPPALVDTSGIVHDRELVDISAHHAATCALDTAGRAYCWGLGTHGHPYDDEPPDPFQHSTRPVAVDDSGVLSGKTLASIGGQCAIDRTGDLYCWGRPPMIEPHRVER